jgi:hypothetical protein
MYGRRTSSVFSISTTFKIYKLLIHFRWITEGVTYLHLPEARSVAGSHILVESVDSGNTGHLTVLLVHVVGAGARVVADPDTEVLDLLGALLVDLRIVSALLRFVLLAQKCVASCAVFCTHLVYRDDLAVRLLDLAELAKEVPEPRLSDDLVGRKNAHTVDLGVGVGL